LGRCSNRWQNKNLKFILADANFLSFSDNSLDLIASFEFIEHIIDIDKVLNEMP